MPLKFDPNDADHIAYMIHKRRPDWNKKGIARVLGELAEAGASLGQATSAAENAALNKKADTPGSIKWPEHMPTANGGKEFKFTTHRYCQVCELPVKHPVETMTQNRDGHWLCKTHSEES